MNPAQVPPNTVLQGSLQSPPLIPAPQQLTATLVATALKKTNYTIIIIKALT